HRLLRSIEHVTKQKIEVATVPTVADLRARRLELTSPPLRGHLATGAFDDVRVVGESLAGDFDVLDIAAAAVKMAHMATVGNGEEREIAAPAPQARPDAHVARARPARLARAGGAGPPRLFVGAGRAVGIRPADLVGSIAGEANVSSKAIG